MTATKTDIPTGLTFQDMLLRLSEFWARHGCVLALPYDLEVGAGTMCPETFLRVLGPEPWRVAYPQPSRRPADGRYGENPNRLLKHTQMQVVLKPPPTDIQDIYLQSLGELGINLREHDIRFEEDNWEAPTLGAWGVGWQVMLDGLEITQFTYFQQCGGIDLEPISVELTYGLERIAAFLQNVQDVYEVRWNNSLTYGDLRRAEELELSVYDFEMADAENCRKVFDLHEAEALRLLDDYRKSQKSGVRAGPRAPGQESVSKSQEPMPNCEDVIPAREHVIPAKAGIQKEGWIPAFAGMTADGKRTTDYGRRFPLRKVYELCLKCSHLFNILDARGAISVTERVALIARIRKLACLVARIYVGRMSPITEAANL